METPAPRSPDPGAGLLFARVLDGSGGARVIGWEECRAWLPSESNETLWLHMERTAAGVDDWLVDDLGFSQATSDALLAEETRPRAFREGEALVAVLRGINLISNAEPDDMITLRIWANSHRVLTLRRRPLQTPTDISERLARGDGPKTAGDLVTDLVQEMIAKIGGSILDMNDRIDRLEAGSEDLTTNDFLSVIAQIRRNCLGMKRHMSPQHEALEQLGRNPPPWLGEDNCRDIREAIDRLKRYLEDLDVSKESAVVLQDDINTRANAESNRRVYLLTIAAAIFLPASLITSLLGVNLQGVWGEARADGFSMLVGLLAGLTLVQLIAFRLLKWI